jgi:DNA-directed RNA polymerase specialized sigma24 family protein
VEGCTRGPYPYSHVGRRSETLDSLEITVAARGIAVELKSVSDRLQQACGRYRQELRRFFRAARPQAGCVENLVQLVYRRLLRSRPLEEVIDPRQFMYRVAWNELRRENERLQREQQVLSCDSNQLQELIRIQPYPTLSNKKSCG